MSAIGCQLSFVHGYLYENNCQIYHFWNVFHAIIDKSHKIPLRGICKSSVFVAKTSIDFVR